MVEGILTQYTLAGTTDTNFTIDSGATVINDPKWSLPASWMQKTAEQSPYTPLTDPNQPEYINGPCDPNGPNYDAEYFCEGGVAPGERGLMLWTKYDSGRDVVFEITYATDNQIVVTGRFESGETFTSPKPFSLRYGMNIKKDIADFGFCADDPLFCSENIAVQCTTNNDCPNAANGETCSTPLKVQCATDGDCPNGSPCNTMQVPANEFSGPDSMADNDGLGGDDPLYDTYDLLTDTGQPTSGLKDATPTGICQVCHTRTKFWTASGEGASHGNGQVCTRCHEHTNNFVTRNGTCQDCHSYPPTSDSHFFHSTVIGYTYNCSTCHYGGMPATIQNGAVQIGFDTFNVDNSNAIYYGKESVTYDGTSNGTNINTQVIPVPPTDPNYLTCKNVYCHSQGKRLTPGYNDLPSTSTPWNAWDSDIQGDNFKCNNCHAFPPGWDPHVFHAVRGYGCEICHAATTPNGYTISDKSRHVNGRYDVEPGSAFYFKKQWHNLSFVYTEPTDPPQNGFFSSGGTCSSNSCHQRWGYKDPSVWKKRPQEITNVTIGYTQGACDGSPGVPATEGAITVEVTANCPDCTMPYTCDFDWGDGNQDNNVPCTAIQHTYTDIIPAPYDPTGTVIGAFPLTWTIRDLYGTSLAEGTRTERVEVCPLPNEPPMSNFIVEIGPDPDTYDVVLTDLSYDPDYNLGTHYDPNGVVPGEIWIKWGGFAPGAAVKGELHEPIELTDQPSGRQFAFTYAKSGSYYIRHGIKDNHGTSEIIWSPTTRFYVSKW